MNVNISISKQNRLVALTGHGDLSLELTLETLKNVANHPDYHPHYGVLGDLRQVDKTLTLADMKPLASYFRKNKITFQGKWALVVRPERAKISATLCMLVKPFGIDIEPFYDMESALKHLS
jgi:hypothetical protein